MEEKNEVIIGNITTIITSISLSFAGLIIGILASYGLKLPIDQTSLAGVIGLIIMFLFSIVNTKYKSTFFTDENVLKINIDGLSNSQITAIQEFVDDAMDLNETYDEDPSLAYEVGDESDGC